MPESPVSGHPSAPVSALSRARGPSRRCSGSAISMGTTFSWLNLISVDDVLKPRSRPIRLSRAGRAARTEDLSVASVSTPGRESRLSEPAPGDPTVKDPP
jgi:hypothetical protein